MPAYAAPVRNYGGKSANMKVEFNGPIWNPFVGRAMRKAASGEIEKLAHEGAQFVVEEMQPGHGVLSGAFASSISGELRGELLGVVRSDSALPIRTWLETGYRRGRKTGRRGGYFFRHGKTKLAATGPADRIGKAVAKVLN